ncbi:hypothetical protein M404DRAFT_503674 [Pisolithus tinctorius Marx 270]|uniref:Uncharacterized protein n=1 Tax=Pisolithus tinctorius Marx 270 TaxID=870435 RepID=A0A0C3NY68_PISTI|nr:hypothetical protein M404DRAFT_503674 [Pisolithus tinctorius Marx 270]
MYDVRQTCIKVVSRAGFPGDGLHGGKFDLTRPSSRVMVVGVASSKREITRLIHHSPFTHVDQSMTLFALAGSLFRATTPNTTWFHGCLTTDRKCPCSFSCEHRIPARMQRTHIYITHVESQKGSRRSSMWQPVDGWEGPRDCGYDVVGLRNPKGVAIHRLDGSSSYLRKIKSCRDLQWMRRAVSPVTTASPLTGTPL